MGPLDSFFHCTAKPPQTRTPKKTTSNPPPYTHTTTIPNGVGTLRPKRVNSKGKSNHLSVTQINLKKKKNAWDTLVAFNKNNINPVILVTEPYSNTNNTIPKINPNLVPYYCSDGPTVPRAAVIIHKHLVNHSRELQQFTTPDIIALLINHEGKDIIFASSYMDITQDIPPAQSIPLINYANSNKLPLILGSDTNAQHTLWGNKQCNRRGEDLLDLLSNLGLNWANKGNTPTFINSRGHESIIDLTITNNLANDIILDWKVDLSYSNSDHRYVTFKIESKQENKPRQIRLTKNTDWELFDNYLSNNPTSNVLDTANINTSEDLDMVTTKLNKHLLNAFNEACPITYISSTVKKPPWLTPSVEEAHRDMKRKLMVARAKKTDKHWTALRLSNKTYNKLHSKTKRNEWRKFCADTESIKESARMNKILKNTSSKTEKIESVYKSDGTLTETPDETLQVMENSHFKTDDTTPHTTDFTIPSTQLIHTIYSKTRMEEAIMSFDPLKAAGPDTLQPITLQKAWKHISNDVITIMTKSHEMQHIPKPWTEANGIFIPKPGKTDYNKPNSFRTITLSSTFLKLQEKAILWHMQHDLGMEDSLSKKQFGFKKGTSTETALHKVIHKIERRIARKGYVLGTFLDIEGAFDNVSFKAISEAIDKSPLDSTSAGWIKSMVTNRHVTISHKNSTRRIRIKRGCPQGGILSPFLWNLVIDDLLHYTAKLIPGYLQAFADDIMTLAEGDDLDIIWQRTQTTIKTIESWCDSKGLNISALKTKIVMFTWNRKWTIRPIKVCGQTIELSKEVKLLGITIDNKLNFNTHIDTITKKCIGSLFQCKRAMGPTWGLSPKVCKWIYTSIIKPTLAYGAVIWIRAVSNKTNIKKLERVQGLALRYMAGAMPTTPYTTLNYLTVTPHIVDYLKGEAAKGTVRLMGQGDWTLETALSGKGIITSHSTISNNFLKDTNIPKPDKWDITKPKLRLDNNFTITFPSSNSSDDYINSLTDDIREASTQGICCFTDGSKTEHGVGGGYVITHADSTTEHSFKMMDYCTVFQAETAAIMYSAIKLSTHSNQLITFWSDSLSSLQALSNKVHKSKSITDCHRALTDLSHNNKVHLRWIKAHTGLWGNEKADQLAKAGSLGGDTVESLIPLTHIKNIIDNKVNELSNTRWYTNKHAHTDLVIGNHQDKILKTLDANVCNRIRYRTAVNIITGHIGLNKHLYRINRADSPNCPNCLDTEETVEHFIGQCPTYYRIRGDILGTYYDSINNIVDNNNMDTIISYALKTKRLMKDEDKDNTGVT